MKRESERKEFIAVDTSLEDKSCMVKGSVDKNGVYHIEKILYKDKVYNGKLKRSSINGE